ncbi:MAG: N-acetylmuramoyl-L-alanine amidase [Chlorobiaceae bacterium]|nr:N-acetylmuramoyl-L-alanine amidase [Chlorobiaceae bacterium]NTV16427.1 N-acetylmuramoyl-L-alanine amidase [Chlorobiaceae bacterium]
MPHLLLRLRSRLVSLMLMTLLLLSFGTLSAEPLLQPGQTSVPLVVTMGNDQGYTIKVLALRKGNTLMIDLESMARAMRMSFRKELGTLVVEESFGVPGSICTITAGNNFVRVVSRDPELPERIIQMQSAPSLRQARIYLPVTQVCRLLTVWLDREVVYDYSSDQISALLRRKSFRQLSGTIGVLRNEEQFAAPGPVTDAEGEKTVITGIDVENRANGAIVSFSASGAPTQASLLDPNPDGYVYFSLEKATGDINALSRIYSRGVIRTITPKQFDGGGLQFAIALDNRSFAINSVEFQRDKKSNSYLLFVRSDADVEEIRRKEKEQQIAQVISNDVEKWKLNTIVLDAGHGGKDPGAIGGSGTREKDVVLNIVHDLGAFISQKWPDVRVIYTRRDDSFIPLHKRGKIANQSGGKLFISVHCNASLNRKARGSEVYILGPHKNKAALDVAMFENSVIRQEADYTLEYKGFTEEHLIMSSMAQSAFAKQSTFLAQDILKPDYRQSSNNSRGVRQAGFMVLWTPSMPSALVEVGYLSNPEEEQILRDRSEQAKIAYGIFQGVQAYRKNYETSNMAAMER